MDAAQAWRNANTNVTGLDLVDVYLNDAGRVSALSKAKSLPKNVTFVRSNLYVFVVHAAISHTERAFYSLTV